MALGETTVAVFDMPARCMQTHGHTVMWHRLRSLVTATPYCEELPTTPNIRAIKTIHLVSCCSTTAWRVLRLRIEERHPIWTVAANTLNKQSRTADKGCFSSLGGEVLKNPHSKTGHVANHSQRLRTLPDSLAR